jgi:hypothetical protein
MLKARIPVGHIYKKVHITIQKYNYFLTNQNHKLKDYLYLYRLLCEKRYRRLIKRQSEQNMSNNTEKINRIILIGNGFDLAHGLKTSYGHFIKKFWEEQLVEVNNSSADIWKLHYSNCETEHYLYENDLFIMKRKDNLPFKKNDITLTNENAKNKQTKENNTATVADSENKKTNEPRKFTLVELKEKGLEIAYKDAEELKKDIVYYKNKFLENIEDERHLKNWFDIEELYFKKLIDCKKRYLEKKNYSIYTVKQLNSEFQFIKEALEKQLELQNDRIDKMKTDSDEKKKIEKIKERITNILKKTKEGQTIDKTYIINFNYTKTEELYSTIPNLETNHLHGTISKNALNKKTQIVFGYGDETSEEFKAIQSLEDNEFMANFKSINYLESENYQKFLKFFENKETEYEIFIFGLSCSGADRSLLNGLFESKNCKSIQFYYYQENANTNNYNDIATNIYRNFDHKDLCREKLVPFSLSEALIPIESTKQPDDNTFINRYYIKVKKPTTEVYTLLENNAKREIKQDFYICKYPVTQELWEEIMGYNPSWFQGDKLPAEVDNNKLPVEQVSWYDAVLFCNKLSEKYNLEMYYNINGEDITTNAGAKGFRLPTEAEWEYAARNGKNNETLEYSGSDNIDAVAWYYENSGDKKLDESKWKYVTLEENKCRTHEVGTKNPNGLGIHDMSGNVWEWCYDLYDDTSYRVLRGGGWRDYARHCLVSKRDYGTSSLRSEGIGFRLVLPL